jgi:hypothetical protein
MEIAPGARIGRRAFSFPERHGVRHLRLIMRVFRRSGMADQFPALIESLLEARTPEQFLAAAE